MERWWGVCREGIGVWIDGWGVCRDGRRVCSDGRGVWTDSRREMVGEWVDMLGEKW